jgi:hypothetical protein
MRKGMVISYLLLVQAPGNRSTQVWDKKSAGSLLLPRAKRSSGFADGEPILKRSDPLARAVYQVHSA